jgi:hypothetical protein
MRVALGLEHTEMHVPASEKRRRHPDWEEAFTFSVVRNPFTRLVSQFTHRKTFHGLDWTSEDFEEWLRVRYVQERRDCGPDKPYFERLWWPQWRWVCEGRRVIVDRVFRFERLDEAWDAIRKEIGTTGELPHLNPSSVKKDWTEFYTGRSAEMVKILFRRDFKAFGYDDAVPI